MMAVRAWVTRLFLLTLVGLLSSMPAAATSFNYVYVGSPSGQLYGVDVDTGEVRLLTTSTQTSANINTLAANDNACLAYYGDETSVFYWDETTDVHTLIADLSTGTYTPPFAGFNLESGGGTFWNPTNTYYVGAEETSGGDIEAVYALEMTADGTGIASITRLDVEGDATVDTDPGDAIADLGGFGDIISIDNGSGGVLLFGSTRNSGVLIQWTYDPAGATPSARFAQMTPPPGNLNMQLARTPDGRVWAGYTAPSGPYAGEPVLQELDIDLGTKTVSFTGSQIPLDPAVDVTDLTAPACRPQIGVAKRVVAGPTALGDGTYNVTFEFLIEALGDFPLWDIQVTDDLTTEFGTLTTGTPDAPGEYAVAAGPTITAENPSGAPPNSDLTANASFDGDTDLNLLSLSSGDVVEVGASVTLRFTVRFYPSVGVTQFENQARAEGDSREDGTTDGDTIDVSDDGDETDPDGDDNPDETDTGCATDPMGSNCENDPTVIDLPPPISPQIGIAKTVSTPTSNGDGTFTVTYTLLVENLGDVELFDLRITDDLTAPFGTNVEPGTPDAVGEFSVGAVTVGLQTGGATVATANGSYDGDGDAVLVGPVSGESMPVGSTFTVSFPVRFYPDGARAPFENQARSTGDVSEDGTADEHTVDLSDDGTDPDPNGNGDPGDPGEDDPTPFDLEPQIGIAKTVSTPSSNGDGSFTVTYTLLVENLGQYELFDVRITDDLTGAFGSYVEPAVPSAAGEYTVGSVTVGSQTGGATVATANASFDGDADTALVLPVSGQSMPVGSTFSVSFAVTFYPDAARAPFENQARVTGDITENSIADEDTVDLSDDGTDTDPNGNGDPGDPGEDDPTSLPPFDTAVNPVPVSGPLGIALLVLAIAVLGWSRLRGIV